LKAASQDLLHENAAQVECRTAFPLQGIQHLYNNNYNYNNNNNKKHQPTTNNQQPTTNNQQPTANNQQPTTNNNNNNNNNSNNNNNINININIVWIGRNLSSFAIIFGGNAWCWEAPSSESSAQLSF